MLNTRQIGTDFIFFLSLMLFKLNIFMSNTLKNNVQNNLCHIAHFLYNNLYNTENIYVFKYTEVL